MHVTTTESPLGPSLPAEGTPSIADVPTLVGADRRRHAYSPPNPDAVDSLAPTHRVAPQRTETPQAPRRRWRPRPALTDAVMGIAGFLSLVTVITAPAAAFGGGGLTLAMTLAVAFPPAVTAVALQRGARARPSQRTGLVELSWLLSGLSACMAVGLSVGGVAWGGTTAPFDALSVLEPVLVASAYSVVTALCAAFLAWRLHSVARTA